MRQGEEATRGLEGTKRNGGKVGERVTREERGGEGCIRGGEEGVLGEGARRSDTKGEEGVRYKNEEEVPKGRSGTWGKRGYKLKEEVQRESSRYDVQGGGGRGDTGTQVGRGGGEGELGEVELG